MEDFNISRRTIQTIYKAVRFFGEGAWNENARLKADGERRILKRFPPTAQINWTDWKQRSDVFSNETVGGILGRGPRQRQLSEPGNEANNERGERGDNVGEQLLLSQPPPRRLLLLLVPDRTGLALFDLPDAQTFELPAPGAPLSPSCHLASHLLGKSSLAVNWQRSVAALLR